MEEAGDAPIHEYPAMRAFANRSERAPDDPPSPLRHPRTWLVITCAWTVEGLVIASQYRAMRGSGETAIEWSRALATGLGSAWLWILPTALAVWLAERWPLRREALLPALAAHLAGVAGVVVFRASAVVVLNRWVGWYAELPPFGEVLLTSVFNNVFVYLLLVGVGHAVHYGRTARIRERQLDEARLNMLKAQIHPHFLFNTLNTISSFVRTDPLKAEWMIARLSAMLRVSLDRAMAQEVPLSDELRFLEPYLEIEQTRFADRLNVRLEVEPEVLGARVPSLLLQPLVENAVRHGVSRRIGAGRIEIRAWREGDRLRVEVRDDGAGVGEAPVLGIGLGNVRARLRQLYGERFAFSLEDAPGGGAVARIALPFAPVENGRG